VNSEIGWKIVTPGRGKMEEKNHKSWKANCTILFNFELRTLNIEQFAGVSLVLEEEEGYEDKERHENSY
jgi:hypothetical protein